MADDKTPHPDGPAEGAEDHGDPGGTDWLLEQLSGGRTPRPEGDPDAGAESAEDRPKGRWSWQTGAVEPVGEATEPAEGAEPAGHTEPAWADDATEPNGDTSGGRPNDAPGAEPIDEDAPAPFFWGLTPSDDVDPLVHPEAVANTSAGAEPRPAAPPPPQTGPEAEFQQEQDRDTHSQSPHTDGDRAEATNADPIGAEPFGAEQAEPVEPVEPVAPDADAEPPLFFPPAPGPHPTVAPPGGVPATHETAVGAAEEPPTSQLPVAGAEAEAPETEQLGVQNAETEQSSAQQDGPAQPMTRSERRRAAEAAAATGAATTTQAIPAGAAASAGGVGGPSGSGGASGHGGSGGARSAGGGGTNKRTTRILFWIAGGLLLVLILIGLYVFGTQLPGVFSAAPAAAPTPTATKTKTPTPTPTPTVAPTGPQAPGAHAWDTLRGGECINPFTTPWAQTFTIVDCATPHAAQLVYTNVFSADPAAAFPGVDQLASQINLLCTKPGIINMDVAGQIPDAQVQGSYPVTEKQWKDGQRSYFCFVNRSGGEPITGSIAGPGPTG